MLISVVIPTLNEGAQVDDLLGHLEAAPEVIVCDGGSTDDTVPRALRWPRARVVRSAPGRARQMNRGALQATGDVLLFLHADTRLGPGALESVREALWDRAIVGGQFAKVPFRSHWALRLADALADWRIRRRLLLLGDRAIFVRRNVFERIGGYADLDLMEDVDLGRRLLTCGRLAVLQPPVMTSERRFLRGGVWRTLFLMGALGLLFELGLPASGLQRRYRPYR